MSTRPVPRGIEVLVKKASVDPEFKAFLVARRGEAAAEIGLVLDPAEAAMLGSIPAAQLEAIIAHTTVSPMTRSAFLGRAASAMLAALGAGFASGAAPVGSRGISPDRPPDAPPKPTRFVVYCETDYKGEVSCAVVDFDAYEARAAEAAKETKLSRKAYALAKKAWKDDAEHANEPFPMKPPQQTRCTRLAMYPEKPRAEAIMQRKQKELDDEKDREKEREKTRLERMNERMRQREEKRIEFLKAAHALYEAKLKELLAGDEEAKREPTPPA